MIVHIMRFSFRPDTSEEARGSALAAFETLAASEATEFSIVGNDIGDPSDGYTHAACVAVRDLERLRAYMFTPLHRAADLAILPHIQKLTGFDFATEATPDLGDKVRALHQERVESSDYLGPLLEAIPELNLGGQ